MDLDYGFSSHSTSESSQPPQPSRQKRTRILLSCAPCRVSKLKCDRGSPCGQCQKKDREDLCQYAPKPEKRKPAKSMAARLKRLEGMVRGMMDADGNHISQPSQPGPGEQKQGDEETPQLKGQVVRGQNEKTSYIGATHCMAMLEDIEDLKDYFEDSETEDNDTPPDETDGPDLVFFSRGAPKNREELLTRLPDKQVADRLITRYFQSMNPSQHIIHRPTFARTYARFWQDPHDVTLHWIAQLFMMLAMGTLFNSYQAPHEIESDSPVSVPDRIKLYRSCAGWALVWGKYMQPNTTTLPAFILYVESHFVFNRAAQMSCYILSGVCVRLMLKMGLHREPDKLAGLSPFEGEMRRRMWNLAIQVESIVAFHMGLPSMIQSIESDTAIPRNLEDDDFDEDTEELPLGRPDSVWTSMTYPIHKTNIVRVFAQIAKQMHALTLPSYSEVLRLDHLLQDTWHRLPSFMVVRPLDECVGDPPMLVLQRFGLAALYNKSRCVLHRRYLAEPVPIREHDYSRQQCLQAALTLLEMQVIIWDACKPGHSLAHHGWFISSLAVHDYLLAAMVLYLVIQNEHYGDPSRGHDWADHQTTSTPTKQELTEMIRRSHDVWSHVAETTTEVRRTADTLAVMLARLGMPIDRDPSVTVLADPSPVSQTVGSGEESVASSSAMPELSVGASSNTGDIFPSVGFDGSMSGTGQTFFDIPQGTEALDIMSFPGMESAGSVPGTFDLDSSWMSAPNNMDWRFLDISLAHSHSAPGNINGPGPVWMERAPPMNDMTWGTAPSQQGVSE